jgi:hypothetical protein
MKAQLEPRGVGSAPWANRGSMPSPRPPSAGTAMRRLPNNMPVSTVPRALVAP